MSETTFRTGGKTKRLGRLSEVLEVKISPRRSRCLDAWELGLVFLDLQAQWWFREYIQKSL